MDMCFTETSSFGLQTVLTTYIDSVAGPVGPDGGRHILIILSVGI